MYMPLPFSLQRYISPYFWKIYYFPLFWNFLFSSLFLSISPPISFNLRVLCFSPTLTVIRLCIVQCMYWAPLKSAYSRALRQIKGVGQGSWSSSFIHSGYFYSASSSPLLLRGAPVYCVDTCVRVNTPK